MQDRSALMPPGAQVGGADIPRLFLIAGMAFLTVVDLFAAQALLPTLSKHYGVPPAAMGLAVNACTLGMAVGGLGVALLGHRMPRRSGIVVSLLLLAVPTVLLAIAPNLMVFSALRVAQGLAMSTAFGLTLAHLGERYMAESAASAFAAYITGNVASNLIGRLIATAVTDHAGLSTAFGVFALLNLSGAVLAFLTINRVPEGLPMANAEEADKSAFDHFRDPALRSGFIIGFCILFAFIGTFTYINFELVKPPLSLGMMGLGVVYFVFLPSIVTTPLAGRTVSAVGVRPALWGGLALAGAGLPMLLAPSLGLVLGGMVLVAVGTFFAQAVATGFVSRTASHNKSAASGIYLASYFLGGLAGSAVLGRLYEDIGWNACVAGIGLALALAAGLTFKLRRRSPQPLT
ncbi:MFS transporter [uncultured Hyphomicrobium sp.]|uniref:MFS transporter n=1 Tax=uncultured Hyphomicrobium sp. TaxID=194373 RepID=UPI0025D7E31E|nr:MFS transporter [uncultured Hyphomicrobium sp.]